MNLYVLNVLENYLIARFKNNIETKEYTKFVKTEMILVMKV